MRWCTAGATCCRGISSRNPARPFRRRSCSPLRERAVPLGRRRRSLVESNGSLAEERASLVESDGSFAKERALLAQSVVLLAEALDSFLASFDCDARAVGSQRKRRAPFVESCVPHAHPRAPCVESRGDGQ